MKAVVLLIFSSVAFGQGIPFPGGGLVHAVGSNPIALVDHITLIAAGGPSTAINSSGASLLIAACSTIGTTSPTVSDSKSNTWVTGPPTQYSNAATYTVQLYYATSVTVGTGHTFSLTGGSANFCSFSAWSNTKTTAPFDTENGATNNQLTLQPGSITPAADNALIISIATEHQDNTTAPTVDSGMTILDSSPNAGNLPTAVAYKIQTTATAINPTWTSGDGVFPVYAATVADFKAP